MYKDNIFSKGKKEVIKQYNKPIDEFKDDLDKWKGIVIKKKKEFKGDLNNGIF